MIVMQLILFCLLFTALVKWGVRDNAINGLFFYPKPYQELAYERGIADRETISQKRKKFMLPFVLVMLIALLLIIGLWNKVHEFQQAYLQALLFLEVMNWYDGIFIDEVWVGYSSFWKIPGMENIPYVQTWKQMLKKRIILTGIWIIGAAIVAGMVVVMF